jgi:hypothetical protein
MRLVTALWVIEKKLTVISVARDIIVGMITIMVMGMVGATLNMGALVVGRGVVKCVTC